MTSVDVTTVNVTTIGPMTEDVEDMILCLAGVEGAADYGIRSNGVFALFDDGGASERRAAESFRDAVIGEASLKGKIANISLFVPTCAPCENPVCSNFFPSACGAYR